MKLETMKPIAILILLLGIAYLVKVVVSNNKTERILSDVAKKVSSCDMTFRIHFDRMTGDTTYILRDSVLFDCPTLIDSGYVSIVKGKRNFTQLMFFLGKNVCIEGDDKILFLFEDSSRVSCTNDEGFNCDGLATVTSFDIDERESVDPSKFKSADEILEKYNDFPHHNLFKSKELVAVRVSGTKRKYEFEIPVDYRAVIKSAFICLDSISVN